MSAISGPRIDFYNCPCDNLNNIRILTHRHLFVSDSNNGPSPGFCNLGEMKDTPFSGLPLMVSWWVQYLVKCPRPDFNNGPGDNLNGGCILALSVYLSLSPGHSNLGTRKITTACTIAALLISRFFLPKCFEASFKQAQSG